MFDRTFYRGALPERVEQQCAMKTGQIPVVELRLADGATLDICHIVHLAEPWFAVAYYRDAANCDDMDLVFLPYQAVTRVALSMHDPRSRRLGFKLEHEPGPLPVTPVLEGGVR